MKYAVVTGASSGMGLEFARQLAERKYGIVIVSNQPEENRRVAEMLRRQNHVDVRVIDMDLTLPKAAEDIYQQVTSWELEVEVLVSNAGMDYRFALHDTCQVDSSFRGRHVETAERICVDHFFFDGMDALSDNIPLCGDQGFSEVFLSVDLV